MIPEQIEANKLTRKQLEKILRRDIKNRHRTMESKRKMLIRLSKKNAER